jgi:D-alanyl-D-alanine carboxypeptidase/D-alanyl-D-alanine-endopeptidase (penicillin-binding protein 4)
MGKVFKNNGTTAAGIEVLYKFLEDSGINTTGMFIEDGSGVSPLDAINARGLTELLFYMRNKSKYFNEFYSSLPDAGKEGTLKNYFKDTVFDSNLRAKSGSMTRVRSYAGYFRTLSGRDLAFCIIINNYSGSPKNIVKRIEEMIKETILYK